MFIALRILRYLEEDLCILVATIIEKREREQKDTGISRTTPEHPYPASIHILRSRRPHQAATPTFEAPALAFLLLRTAPGLASVYFANALPNCLLQLIF